MILVGTREKFYIIFYTLLLECVRCPCKFFSSSQIFYIYLFISYINNSIFFLLCLYKECKRDQEITVNGPTSILS